MELEAVRDAYSCVSGQYIELFDEVDPNDPDAVLIRKYLTGLPGPVLDLGCGPGQWTAHLHRLGVDVTGVDLVPEFVAHARVARPGPEFQLGSFIDIKATEHSLAGILAWYSLIHLPPAELGGALSQFRQLLTPAGMLVLGFFDSDDGLAAFDHKVVKAYRWPADALVEKLAEAGFTEVERVRREVADRPDRRYGVVVASAS
ncbi:MAG: class I SAM-dependent methyltransferase [Actinomycetota bacterium]|nr:class I SAM-dependent methyltransferase [Actinomycetota bacterium]